MSDRRADEASIAPGGPSGSGEHPVVLPPPPAASRKERKPRKKREPEPREERTPRTFATLSPTTPPTPVQKAPARRPRMARLRLTHIDPWSVTKMAFLLSVAVGVVTIVAVAIVWGVLGASGLWDSIDRSVQDTFGDSSGTPFEIQQYLGASRVIRFHHDRGGGRCRPDHHDRHSRSVPLQPRFDSPRWRRGRPSQRTTEPPVPCWGGPGASGSLPSRFTGL